MFLDDALGFSFCQVLSVLDSALVKFLMTFYKMLTWSEYPSDAMVSVEHDFL